MTAYVLFFSTALSQERLSWIDLALKHSFQDKGGGPAGAPAPAKPDVFVYLTGDALYSLNDTESRLIWASILSLSTIRLVCNTDALEHRGLSLDPLTEYVPNRADGQPAAEKKDGASFWSALISSTLGQCPETRRDIGWLLLSSPYMFPSAEEMIQCFTAALDRGCGVRLFAYLDGCHACHAGQITGDGKNIGEALEELATAAAEKHLSCSMMLHQHSASARGYQSWDDGMGVIGSSCLVRPAHIRDMGAMIRTGENIPVLLSENAGLEPCTVLQYNSHDEPDAIPVTILITRNPYSTDYAYGGIAFAAACAHYGIPSRVIFLEDGIHALTGEHHAAEGTEIITLPELISHLCNNENLHFFALVTSLHSRGVSKSGKLAVVKEIGPDELGTLLFQQHEGTSGSGQRILFF